MTIAPVPLPSERSFGLLFSAIGSIAAAVLAWKGHLPAAGTFAVAAAVLAAIALRRPRWLAMPNRWWFRFGLLLHGIVSPIVLGLIFFVVITPMALVMRITRRDALSRRFESARASYWIERDPPGPDPESFRNQF